jgi:D-xylose transport system permease protein
VASIFLVLSAFGVFALFQWREASRGHELEVIASVSGHLQKTLAAPLVFSMAAIWIASWQGIPYLILLVAGCAIFAETMMQRSTFGLKLYAIGGNPEAARLSGIQNERVVFKNFVIAGLFYGITGIALTARVSGAVAGSAGLFLELDAIAAAIIGGTALTGGKGRILGALVGALLMGSLNNGMSLMNVPTFYQDTARGVVLLLAVFADQFTRKRPKS